MEVEVLEQTKQETNETTVTVRVKPDGRVVVNVEPPKEKKKIILVQ
jgi:predicted  nucleic acid-binding Zn-ribbon protein